MDQVEGTGTTTKEPIPYEPIVLADDLTKYARDNLEAEDKGLLTFLEELKHVRQHLCFDLYFRSLCTRLNRLVSYEHPHQSNISHIV